MRSSVVPLNMPETHDEVSGRGCSTMTRKREEKIWLLHGCYIQVEKPENVNVSSRLYPGLRRLKIGVR